MDGPMSQWSLRALILVQLIASTVLSVAVAEGIARLFIELSQERIYPQVRYHPHPVRGLTLRPSQAGDSKDRSATIDWLVFRINGMTVTTGVPTLRILALGDSCLFGYGVADHEIWLAVRERKLGPRVQVITAGATGYNVFHELSLLRRKGWG